MSKLMIGDIRTDGGTQPHTAVDAGAVEDFDGGKRVAIEVPQPEIATATPATALPEPLAQPQPAFEPPHPAASTAVEPPPAAPDLGAAPNVDQRSDGVQATIYCMGGSRLLMTEYKAHPAADMFPMMGETELAEMAKDIAENGLVDAIVLYEGMVLDGRNRLAACKLAGIEPRFAVIDNPRSPTMYVISKNLHRRHLTTSQRAAIAGEIMPMLAREAKQRMRAGGGDHKSEAAKSGMAKCPDPILGKPAKKVQGTASAIAAKALGISEKTVRRAAVVKETAPEEFEKMKRGETTLQNALRAAKKKPAPAPEPAPPPNKRQQILNNAAKNKMVDVLSQTRGLCWGLPEMNISRIGHTCTRKELQTWADIARESANRLREFASALLSIEGEQTA